ncbi:DNA-binding NarL/FixJ family response regulator [Peptoniphilus olsenii]|uniref:DNA-binding NarL/FixJ family response regulator n=1 Tax=Peptoniphilus olsenii TaxID=411570 RepID=A0ABV2JEP9_9FIRM
MKILLIEDHKMMASALKELIEKDEYFHIDILEDLDKLCDKNYLYNYDIILIDINLNGMKTSLNGLNLAERILKENKKLKIVILSGYNYEYYIKKAKNIGIFGFITKDEDVEILKRKLKSIYLYNNKYFDDEKKSIEKLTENEVQIVKLYCSGLKRSEVAKSIFISERSLAVMLNRIYDKLGVNNYQELMKKSIDLGIIDTF